MTSDNNQDDLNNKLDRLSQHIALFLHIYTVDSVVTSILFACISLFIHMCVWYNVFCCCCC